MAGRLSGSVAVVTGATRGLGKAIALGLGQHGATVYVTGRSEDAGEISGTLAETASAISAAGGTAVPIRCDHSDDRQVEKLFERVRDESGGLDLLVNNAFPSSAVTSAIGLRFWEHDLSIWDDIMDVGLRAHFVASRHAVAAMSGSGGLIVNVSSAGARRYAYGAAYGAGKAGLDKFTADAALELAGTGISMVSIWPGVTQTEMLDHLRGTGDPRLESLLHGVDTPVPAYVVGDAVASLALDEHVERFSGTHLSVKQLNEHYAGTADALAHRHPLPTG